MRERPVASAENNSARWLIDLSPGTRNVPCSARRGGSWRESAEVIGCDDRRSWGTAARRSSRSAGTETREQTEVGTRETATADGLLGHFGDVKERSLLGMTKADKAVSATVLRPREEERAERAAEALAAACA